LVCDLAPARLSITKIYLSLLFIRLVLILTKTARTRCNNGPHEVLPRIVYLFEHIPDTCPILPALSPFVQRYIALLPMPLQSRIVKWKGPGHVYYSTNLYIANEGPYNNSFRFAKYQIRKTSSMRTNNNICPIEKLYLFFKCTITTKNFNIFANCIQLFKWEYECLASVLEAYPTAMGHFPHEVLPRILYLFEHIPDDPFWSYITSAF
jgi:hypothetical protein